MKKARSFTAEPSLLRSHRLRIQELGPPGYGRPTKDN